MNAKPLWKRFQAAPELLVIGGVTLIIALLVLPLPAFLLDVMLTISIASSLLVLLVALDTRDTLDFSACCSPSSASDSMWRAPG